MRIVTDAIPKEVIEEARSYVMKNMGDFKWQSSEIMWSPGLKVGINGSCLIRETPTELREKLSSYLSPMLPPHDELAINYHLWQRGSGIASHNDNTYEFGATLYLNEWDHKWGGLFVWEDADGDGLRVVCPSPGTVVINDNTEDHHVTMISPTAKYARRSVQIWGDR